MSPRPVKPDDALADIERLRVLARHLVADALAADDLVQDAWVAALARPAPPRDLGAWLAGAVRHLARRARRTAQRRIRREEAGASGGRAVGARELRAQRAPSA
jgi:DNA-directed RNA polymerase specialized sigma24 family protein